MAFEEITISTLRFPALDIDGMKFDRQSAEAVFRLLVEMGATKDIKLLWSQESRTIRVMKKFAYRSSITPVKGEKEYRLGDQMYSLKQFIKTLIRFDRVAHKRMKNVESKITTMFAGIITLQKQM